MSGEIKNTLDKVVDTLGGTAGRMSAGTTVGADAFVQNATIGNLYELTAAELALTRSQSPDVQMFARKMIEDHMTAMHQLQSALETSETAGVALPDNALDGRRESMVKHLRDAPDDAFDTTYVEQQVLAHEETVTLMRTYRDGGDNPQLRSVAAGAAPVFERHLAHVKMLKQQAA
jgi:putative membrane protein